MLLHIVDVDSSDDTLCGREACRHCPRGFVWLSNYQKAGFPDVGFPDVENMTPCEDCKEKATQDGNS